MKEENMEFYTEGCNTDVVDAQLEAFDELVEDIMLEALKHMSAKEKLDAKKYRMSAAGKKAIAKHLKKASRAGYKVDKSRSKLAKKIAAFRKDESLDESVDLTEELCEELYNTLTVEELADFDSLVEEIVAFAEACKGKEDEACEEACQKEACQKEEIDPETGEKCCGDEEDMDEAFKHMSATAKAKARKYRMSAAGKKALKKYLKKASRAGYKVDKSRSKLMKKVGAFAKHEAEEMAFAEEMGLTEEQLNNIDSLIADILASAPEILESLKEEGVDLTEACKKANEEEMVKIEIPVDSQEEFDSALEGLEGIEIVSRDEENGINVVMGTPEALRQILDALGYDDEVEDLICTNCSEGCCKKDCDDEEDDMDDDDDMDDEEDDMNEAFKHMSASKKLAAKKYRMSAAGKKALKKYLKKSSRAGYKVDKSRSKLAKKVAAFRNEAIQESLDKQFAATPLFESLNEAESTELKSIVHNAVSSILNQSYEKIAEDVTNDYERYMSEEVMPETCRLFEEYKKEIVKNLNENVESYLKYIAEETVSNLSEKGLIVKSQRSSELESFSESLLDLIKEKLNIIPEQEDILVKNQNTIKELTESIQEINVEKVKMRNKLEEANRQLYVLKNMPSELSESQKETLQNYAEDVLFEAKNFDEFKNAFDMAVNETVSRNISKPEPEDIKESKKEQKSFSSLAESLFRMGKI